MDYQKFKKKLLTTPSMKKEFSNGGDMAFKVSEIVIDARIARGITQKQLAQLVGTKQSSIARLEAGRYLPSLLFLQKVAKSLNAELISPKLLLRK